MKTQLLKRVAFLSFTVAIAFTSCDNSKYPGYEQTESGLYYKFHEQSDTGAKAKEGDKVKVILSYKNNKDSVLFDSQVNNPSGEKYVEFPLGPSSFKGSFEEGLSMMEEGDSASFIISADSVYLKTFRAPTLPEYIDSGSVLTFSVKVLGIQSKADFEKEQAQKKEEYEIEMEMRKNEEVKRLADYLAENNVKVAPTSSGLYFIETVKGKGAKPSQGAEVSVHYTGRLLDGTVFDTSDESIAKEAGLYNPQRPYDPIKFALGTGRVIPGWDEGIALMRKGSKGKLVIPSAIAYGAQGGGQMIPPFSPLVFDVELVEFTPAK